MSGELKAMVDYERHDPAEDDRQRRHPKKPPPATRGAVIVHGLASGGGGYDRAQRAAAVNTSAVLACLAIILFALGSLLDYVL